MNTIMKQDPRFPNLFILNHPLIQHKLSHMRERDTSTRTFRALLKEITLLISSEDVGSAPNCSRSPAGTYLRSRPISTTRLNFEGPASLTGLSFLGRGMLFIAGNVLR